MNSGELKTVDFAWTTYSNILGIFFMDNIQGRPLVVSNWWYKNSTTYQLQVTNVSTVNYTAKDITASVIYLV